MGREYLAEFESVLFTGELEVAADEDEHAAVDTGRLAVDGGDGVVALLEREASELGDDVGSALDLLAFEGEHGSILVEIGQTWTVVVEGGVVVLYECLCQRVWIHLSHSHSLFPLSFPSLYIIFLNHFLAYLLRTKYKQILL